MNKNLLPPFIGVFVSWLVIWQLHSYLLVDSCLDKGGSFEYKTGECIVDNVSTQGAELSSIMLVVYFIAGITVALVVATFIRKIITKNVKDK
jgi:hypothetical protein